MSPTVTVAIFGFRSTRDATAAAVAAGTADITAQIEADRRNRIWEKQAAAYTDAIAGVLHRQSVRQGQWQGLVTGTQPAASAAPVNWLELEGRLVAYSSPAVLTALREAATAGEGFESGPSSQNAASACGNPQGMLAAGWHAHTLNAPGKFLIAAAEQDTPKRAPGLPAHRPDRRSRRERLHRPSPAALDAVSQQALEDQDPYPERTVVLADPDTMTTDSGEDSP